MSLTIKMAAVFFGTTLLATFVFAKPERSSADTLWQDFQNPPREARASCYWWWKSDLTADEMGRQLHLLKEAGLGGAHIIPWAVSKPAYLSPEWLKLLRAASEAARKEGMILDMSANAKWPFAGDWVSDEESLHKVIVEVYQVEGPKKFSAPKKGAARQDAHLRRPLAARRVRFH